MLAPLTGGGGPYGADIVKASKLAADQINAAGGVLGGRKIELFVEGDETSATAAVKAARKPLISTRSWPSRRSGARHRSWPSAR